MPTPIEQLLSRTLYNTDGATVDWDFSFAGGYLDPTHVKARTDTPEGLRAEITVTPEMLIGEYQLRITPALAAGNVLTIYRDTPKDLPLVDFADESGFSEIALDTNAKQAIMVAAETADEVNTSDVSAATAAAADAAAAASSAYAAAVQASAVAAAASASADEAANSAAAINPANFATAAQGALADTAVQPADLGSAAYTASTDYATAAQGAKADTALQPAAIGTSVQPFDAKTAKLDVAQTFTAPQRGNYDYITGAMDLSLANNFFWTPAGAVTLTPSNQSMFQSGYILLTNGNNWAISKAPTVKCSSTLLATISATGTYLLSYVSVNGYVHITGSSALT